MFGDPDFSELNLNATACSNAVARTGRRRTGVPERSVGPIQISENDLELHLVEGSDDMWRIAAF